MYSYTTVVYCISYEYSRALVAESGKSGGRRGPVAELH